MVQKVSVKKVSRIEKCFDNQKINLPVSDEKDIMEFEWIEAEA